MTTRRIYILFFLLVASVVCLAESPGTSSLTPSEYRAELDRLLSAARQLDSSGAPTPSPLQSLPVDWHVHSDHDFDISTEGLKRDVRRYEQDKNAQNTTAIYRRLQMLRAEIDGYEKAPADVSSSRNELNAILARPEFREVHGPTWLDRLKQWLAELFIRMLRKVFGAIAIPTISRYFVYGLMGVALLTLLYVAYRLIWKVQEIGEVIPKDIPVSAKAWAVWLAEARTAAARGDWREAVHLAYWAGISFLEMQGVWKPDRARTPREYLRLFSGPREQKETLNALTRIFELAWYAKRDADATTFSSTLAELEKLGCR